MLSLRAATLSPITSGVTSEQFPDLHSVTGKVAIMRYVKAKAIRHHGDWLNRKMLLLRWISDGAGQTINQSRIIHSSFTCFQTHTHTHTIKSAICLRSSANQYVCLINRVTGTQKHCWSWKISLFTLAAAAKCETGAAIMYETLTHTLQQPERNSGSPSLSAVASVTFWLLADWCSASFKHADSALKADSFFYLSRNLNSLHALLAVVTPHTLQEICSGCV